MSEILGPIILVIVVLLFIGYLISSITSPWSSSLPALSDMDSELDEQKENLTDQQINYYIQILSSKLPAKTTAKNVPFRYEQRVNVENMSIEEKEIHLRAFADEVCKFLLLPKSIYVMFSKSMNAASKYVNADGLHHIELSADLANDKVRRAVLAHAITQYYLNYHNIYIDDDQHYENLTAVASIYLGFGFLMLEGYRAYEVPDEFLNNALRKLYRSVGHINRDTILRGIIATAKARKQQPFIVIDHFRSDHRGWAKRQLSDLIKEYKQHKKKTAAT
jgi:hypothetical protein